MVRKTFFKDCLRSVRGSLSRFLAIFLIVALGAGFLAGLLVTTPDMRHSVSRMFQETRFYDLRIAGNLGLEEADAAAVAGVAGVSAVMPARSLDREVLLSSGDTVVARFHGVQDWEDETALNRPFLVAGRWPQSENECVVMEESELTAQVLAVGQRLSVLPQEADDADGEPPEEPFRQTELEIVGLVHSPAYLSMIQRGSTSMGNGTLGAVVYISDSLLDLDYYTDLYVMVAAAAEAEAFSEAYDEAIAPVQVAVEQLAERQKHVRADRLVGDAQQELDDARRELEEKTAEGRQELEDALRELNDAEADYAEGIQGIADGEAELADAFSGLREGEQSSVEGYQALLDSETEYEDGLARLEEGQQEIDDALAQLEEAYAQIQEGKAQLKAVGQQLTGGEAALEEGEAELKAAQAALDAGQAQLEAGFAQLEEGQAALDAALARLEQQEAALEAGRPLMPEEDYARAKAALEHARQELTDQQAGLDKNRTTLEGQSAALAQSQKELDTAFREMNAGARELSQGRQEYETALAELEQADVERRQGLYRLELAQEELEENREKLAEARTQLDEGWREYEQGKADLKEGWADYYQGQQELADVRQELADARVELDDGWADYEEGQAEFDNKLADARCKLRDAQEQINDIAQPEWYVLTRAESNEGYIFYESDTEKVAAIAKVFPIFFCLVAALVASTTMTRMIDEDRGAIGTLKALGYSNSAIAGKYLLYAAAACLTGAAVGLAVFLPLFPRLIANAYRMMYQVPEIVPADHLLFGAVSAGGILLAVLLATLGALKGVLSDNAAALMRPKAPPAGKRILLERIRPLWRRMRFSHKVTARNLFRYKKRFVMTVIGIAGCTALLVAGFGLRDSIRDIAGLQFNQLQLYDMTLTVEHPGDETADRRIAAVLSGDSVVQEYLAVHRETGEGVADGRTTDLYLMAPVDTARFTDYFNLRRRADHTPVPFTEDAAILTEKAAKVLGIRPGDTLTLRSQEDVEVQVPIGGVCENYVQGYVFLSPKLYQQLFGQSCTFDTLLVKTPELDAGQRDGLAARVLTSDYATGVSFSEDTIETFTDMLSSIDYIVILLIVSAAALAFVVLYNLTNINICERQKEIATLKVLGFYRREVTGYVFRETVLLSLIGTAAGLVAGVFFHGFVVQTAETDAAMFGRIIYPMSFVYSAALSTVFTGLVSLVLRRKLHRIDMVESLKAPE